jgi:hypothetical protein
MGWNGIEKSRALTIFLRKANIDLTQQQWTLV